MSDIQALQKKTKTVRVCRRIVLHSTIVGWPRWNSPDTGEQVSELNFVHNPILKEAVVTRGGAGYVVTNVNDKTRGRHCDFEIPDSNIKAIFWETKEVE